MTAFITLSCERPLGAHGKCPHQVVVFDVDTVAEARAEARRYGWHHSGAGERCPWHNGEAGDGPPIIFKARRG